MELALFGISALSSAVSSIIVATLYVWPWLRTARSDQALAMLVAPHLFLRFIGLSVLVPGVVAAALPPAFAVPAAYGDLIAGLLAIVATIGLARHATWARSAVWSFNIWGAADLIYAGVEGVRGPGQPRLPWRRLLHSDRDRAAAARDACADFRDTDYQEGRGGMTFTDAELE